MTDQLYYVFFAYLFTFTLLLAMGIKSYFNYLSNRKKLNNLNKDINNK